jgi:hypothetical protein
MGSQKNICGSLIIIRIITTSNIVIRFIRLIQSSSKVHHTTRSRPAQTYRTVGYNSNRATATSKLTLNKSPDVPTSNNGWHIVYMQFESGARCDVIDLKYEHSMQEQETKPECF